VNYRQNDKIESGENIAAKNAAERLEERNIRENRARRSVTNNPRKIRYLPASISES
jgi:hypothetical protein